jgi:type II secretory pathway pseudopilin PulG
MSLVEVTITLLCLAIAAMVVFPTLSDTAPEQLRGAAQVVIADLQFAQGQSMSRGDDPRLVVFEPGRNGYSIAPKSEPNKPIKHPIGGEKYVTKFGQGRAASLGKVRIGALTVGGDDQLAFGGLGQLDQTTPATITLTAGSRSLVITIDPITGDATTGAIQ